MSDSPVLLTPGARPLSHPGHQINVTPGPAFGRLHVDCSCGLTRVCASKFSANRVALIHHHEVDGCNCPPNVVAADVHPSSTPTDPGQASPAPVAAADQA